MGGTGKGLLKGYVFPSPFLRTESYVSARIPLPPPVCALGAPSPRERGLRLRRLLRETII